MAIGTLHTSTDSLGFLWPVFELWLIAEIGRRSTLDEEQTFFCTPTTFRDSVELVSAHDCVCLPIELPSAYQVRSA
jgi:hypothetical protein